MTTVPSRQRSRNGFTLIELMVVIGIIVILVGILFPVIRKVRIAAQSADTQNEISQLQNAITQYYADFQAYPGPLPNTGSAVPFLQITGGTPTGMSNTNCDIEAWTASATTGVQLEFYDNSASPPGWPTVVTSMQTFHVTGTENLVLGLLGGLDYDSKTGFLGFNPNAVGLGPLNLNYSYGANHFVSPKRYAPYLQSNTANGYLMWCGSVGGVATRSAQFPPNMTLTPYADEAGTFANDSPIPEFVDRFPQALPILYLRSHTGAAGIVSDSTTTDPNTTNSVVYQYDVRDIEAYTSSKINIPPPTTNVPFPSHNLTGNIVFINQFIAKAGVLNSPDIGPYFASQTVQPTNPANTTNTDSFYNATGRPRAVDSFILISAGPDGIYGTGDDLTSFGNVMP